MLAVLPQLLEKLKNYNDEKHPLWITGHSLDGALAAVVANLSKHPIHGMAFTPTASLGSAIQYIASATRKR